MSTADWTGRRVARRDSGRLGVVRSDAGSVRIVRVRYDDGRRDVWVDRSSLLLLSVEAEKSVEPVESTETEGDADTESATELSDVDQLSQSVLGLLDSATLSQAQSIRNKKIQTYSTWFAATAVYRLFDAVEAVRPGLLDRYLEIKAESDSEAARRGIKRGN